MHVQLLASTPRGVVCRYILETEQPPKQFTPAPSISPKPKRCSGIPSPLRAQDRPGAARLRSGPVLQDLRVEPSPS